MPCGEPRSPGSCQSGLALIGQIGSKVQSNGVGAYLDGALFYRIISSRRSFYSHWNIQTPERYHTVGSIGKVLIAGDHLAALKVHPLRPVGTELQILTGCPRIGDLQKVSVIDNIAGLDTRV